MLSRGNFHLINSARTGLGSQRRDITPDNIVAEKSNSIIPYIYNIGAMAWSPDGQFIASGGEYTQVWSAANGVVQPQRTKFLDLEW